MITITLQTHVSRDFCHCKIFGVYRPGCFDAASIDLLEFAYFGGSALLNSFRFDGYPGQLSNDASLPRYVVQPLLLLGR